MKTKIILSFALLALITACSNDDKAITPDANGKIDVTQNIEFKVNFKDFNAEKEVSGTRVASQTPDTISQQTVDLGNGLLAEVTVLKDTAKTAIPTATRALNDGTYTMLAYQGPSLSSYTLKGKTTGTVKDGKLITSTGMRLEPGEYLFVLHNGYMEEVTTLLNTPGLKLTRANADKAIIGASRYTVTAAPDPQFVDFDMEHAGARLRVKLTGWMPIESTTTASLDVWNKNILPTELTFEIPGFDYHTGGKFDESTPLTFPAANTMNTDGTYTSISNEYLYMVPGGEMDGFQLRLTGGQMYKLPLAGVKVNLIDLPHPAPGRQPVFVNNESYLVNINLKYNFLYLMSDGTTDFLNSTQYTALRQGDGKTPRYVDKTGNPIATPKVPIAVVLSQSRRMAVALKDANDGATCIWDQRYLWNIQTNYRMFNSVPAEDMFNDMDGYKYSWEGSGSADGSFINAMDIMAYMRAGNYSPGVSLTGGLTNKNWYLPSIGEWKHVYTALSLGDASLLTSYFMNHPWNKPMADLAFTQVGGTALLNATYWSSTEFSTSHASVVSFMDNPVKNSLWWTTSSKNTQANVRSFINY